MRPSSQHDGVARDGRPHRQSKQILCLIPVQILSGLCHGVIDGLPEGGSGPPTELALFGSGHDRPVPDTLIVPPENVSIDRKGM